jgi:ribosomal protein S11
MPRRNRNAGTPRPDADQLAADLAQLAAELCPDTWTTSMRGPGKTAAIARYLARSGQAGYRLTVIDAKQPIPHLATESR